MEKLRHLLLGINCSSFASLQLEVHKIQKVFLEGLHNFFLITNVIHNVATCNITAAFTVYTWPPAHHCLPWQHRHSLTLTRPLPSLLLAVSLQLKHQGVPHIIKASLASYSRLLVIRIMKYFLFKYFLSRYKMSDFKVFFFQHLDFCQIQVLQAPCTNVVMPQIENLSVPELNYLTWASELACTTTASTKWANCITPGSSKVTSSKHSTALTWKWQWWIQLLNHHLRVISSFWCHVGFAPTPPL